MSLKRIANYLFAFLILLLLIACNQLNIKSTLNPTTNEILTISSKLIHLLASSSQTQVTDSRSFVLLPDDRAVMASDYNIELVDIRLSKNPLQPGEFSQAQIVNSIQTTKPTLITSSLNNCVAWVSSDFQIHIWSIDSNKEYLISTETTNQTSLSFSPNSENLASASYNKTLTIFRVPEGIVLNTWHLDAWLSNLSFSPDGRLISGVYLPDFELFFINATSGEKVNSIKWVTMSNPVLYGAYLSPQWNRIAWVARSTVQIMSVSDGSLGPTLIHEDYINAVTWSPDGQLLAVASAGTINDKFVPTIVIWDVSSGIKLSTITQDEVFTGISFSKDGNELAGLTSSGLLITWSIFP
jgi:WD40 repeat protein